MMADGGDGWRNRIVGHGKRAPEKLLAHPRNWRAHPQHQQDALTAVLDRVRWVQDVIVNRQTGFIVDGHLRVALSLKRGEPFVPVKFVDLTEEEEALILTTLDPIAAMASADKEALAGLLAGLGDESGPVKALLDDLAKEYKIKIEAAHAEDPGADMDRAEVLRDKWDAERGQVWVAGAHRVMCGDATSEADHDRLLAGALVDLVLTDPPYGVGIEYGASTDDSAAVILDIVRDALPLILRWPVVLITSGVRLLWKYPEPSWVLAWVHPAGMGAGPWGFTCLNPVLAYGADPYLARKLGSRADTLVLAADREEVDGHPVPKPLQVWEWLMKRGTPAAGERVLDPFLGSGTTIVAAERLGRIGYGMEIEPKYVAVTLERLAGMGLDVTKE